SPPDSGHDEAWATRQPAQVYGIRRTPLSASTEGCARSRHDRLGERVESGRAQVPLLPVERHGDAARAGSELDEGAGGGIRELRFEQHAPTKPQRDRLKEVARA